MLQGLQISFKMRFFLSFYCLLFSIICLSQTEDFEDGTTHGWTNGGGAGPPINVPDGGPSGVGDNYLRVISDGEESGGRMVVFNSEGWAGNYLDRGISIIIMDANNLGATDLTLRMLIQSDTMRFITLDSIALIAGTGWQTVEFNVTPENLIGNGDANAALSEVNILRIFHSDGANFPGPFIVATLGLDNIRSDQVTSWYLEGSLLEFKIFPNPSAGEIQIEGDRSLADEVEIMDLDGKSVFRAPLSNDRFNLSEFQNGVYFVRLVHIKGPGNNNIEKLLISR